MKSIKSFELNDILSILNKGLKLSLIVFGIYVWIFHYIPDVLFEKDNFRFVFTRHCFFYLQIIITMFGFIILKVAMTNKLNYKDFIFYFLVSTVLVYTRFFNLLHGFLSNYNLYFDIFKTSVDKQSVVSFQYSRIFVIGIVCAFMLGAFIFVKRSLLKLFLIIFSSVFFIFFYWMHLYVARAAYSGYESQLRIQTEIVLNNSTNYKKICPELNLQCYEVNISEINSFNLSKPDVINRIRFWEDTKTESDELIKNLLNKVNDGTEIQKIFMESNITTDNLRAATYGIKKIQDDKMLIIIDFNNLAYALDLYLLYFTLIITIFLIFWGSATVWIYNKHKNFKIIKDLGLVE